MAEYFEKETVLKEIFSIYEREFPTASGAFDKFVTKTVPNILACIPSADVAPVVHGKWIEQEKYTFGVMYDCSICDNLILDNGHSWNYCPNCGAKMDGGNGNSDMA